MPATQFLGYDEYVRMLFVCIGVFATACDRYLIYIYGDLQHEPKSQTVKTLLCSDTVRLIELDSNFQVFRHSIHQCVCMLLSKGYSNLFK